MYKSIYLNNRFIFTIFLLLILIIQQNLYGQELTENNANLWGTYASDQATTSTQNNSIFVQEGNYSVEFITASGFLTGLYYPNTGSLNSDLTGQNLTFSYYAENSSPYGFQAPLKFRLYTNSAYFEYTYSANPIVGTWQSFDVPITGSSYQSWTVTTSGNPSISNITKVEFEFDTWDAGFTIYLDDVKFYTPLSGDELTESSANLWGTYASDQAATSTSNNTQNYLAGNNAVQFTTASGFETGLYYPKAADAQWDLDDINLHFAYYAVNSSPVGFQMPLTFRLYTGTSYFEYTYAQFPQLNNWYVFDVLLNGQNYQDWTVTTIGTPNINNINKLEFVLDTWDYGFDFTLDAVRFSECPVDNSINTNDKYFVSINSPPQTLIDLDAFFSDVSCPGSPYFVQKESPGIIPNIINNVLYVTPTPNFLGKTVLTLSVACTVPGNTKTIEIYTQPDDAMAMDCNIKIVDVGVYNFDPEMPQYNNQKVHEAYNFLDPKTLTEQYFDEMTKASENYVYYNLTYWEWVNDWNTYTDGFKYDALTYDNCWVNQNCHPGNLLSNYPLTISQYGIEERINKNEFEEVWWFGGPHFGYFESAMAGPGAYWINGTPYPNVDTDRPFVIMGFNYERTVDLMMHSNGHRSENHINRAYGNTWNQTNPVTNWDFFTTNFTANPSGASFGVGNIHFPPNGASDYDYANPNFVTSTALDWANYPHLTGATTQVNRDTWGVPNYDLGYMRFWYDLLPRADGINPDGRMNNWWKYIYDFTNYDTNGASTNTGFDVLEIIPTTFLSNEFGTHFLTNINCLIDDADLSLPRVNFTTSNNGINISNIGGNVFLHSTENFSGLVTCTIHICDGDISETMNFDIIVYPPCVDSANLVVNSGDEVKAVHDFIKSTAIIAPNSNVIYDAGNYVELKAGFISPVSTDLKILVNGCF